jgi:hypothetical protein
MAERYRSGYLVPRRRGTLSHAKALTTGECLHLESVHMPQLIFCPCPYTSLCFLVAIGRMLLSGIGGLIALFVIV